MIKHIVMWRLKDFAEGATKIENCKRLKTKLEALPGLIADIDFAEAGVNFAAAEAAFDVVLYSQFKDKAALRRYQEHPEHQKLISEFLDKVRTDKVVVDYEV